MGDRGYLARRKAVGLMKKKKLNKVNKINVKIYQKKYRKTNKNFLYLVNSYD